MTGLNAPDRVDKFVVPPELRKVEMRRITKQKNAAEFEFQREDHTMGNLIRCKLLEDPHVLFAGYKMPHPLEHRMLVQIQTDGFEDPENNSQPYRPKDALARAIKSLLHEFDLMRLRMKKNIDDRRTEEYE